MSPTPFGNDLYERTEGYSITLSHGGRDDADPNPFANANPLLDFPDNDELAINPARLTEIHALTDQQISDLLNRLVLMGQTASSMVHAAVQGLMQRNEGHCQEVRRKERAHGCGVEGMPFASSFTQLG